MFYAIMDYGVGFRYLALSRGLVFFPLFSGSASYLAGNLRSLLLICFVFLVMFVFSPVDPFFPVSTFRITDVANPLYGQHTRCMMSSFAATSANLEAHFCAVAHWERGQENFCTSIDMTLHRLDASLTPRVFVVLGLLQRCSPYFSPSFTSACAPQSRQLSSRLTPAYCRVLRPRTPSNTVVPAGSISYVLSLRPPLPRLLFSRRGWHAWPLGAS